MATRHVLAELLAAAVDAGLPAVEVESVGGVDAADRVAAGEAFDLVFLASGALARLEREGHVGAATPLVLSQTAVAVPGHSLPESHPSLPEPPSSLPESPLSLPEPVEGQAFRDAAALQDALRAAARIGYSTGPSGTALVNMISEWGLADELEGRLVQARPGVPVAASLAAGDVDLGFQQLSELVGQPGIRILGVMPADCAIDTVFAGAVAAASASPDDAAAVLAFLASDAVSPVKRRHAFRTP